MRIFVVFLGIALAACEGTPERSDVYLLELAGRVRALDPNALHEILVQADHASDSERRALAALASAYVRGSPVVFLEAQRTRKGCFGVSYLTFGATESPDASTEELASRRAALQSVTDAGLSEARSRCLAVLAGS
jgi:hypothetical protein